MTLQAVKLCAQKGHPFEVVFSQQWVLSETSVGELPGFTEHRLGPWGLHTGPDLNVAYAGDPERGIFAAVLGQAVDLAGAFVDHAVLRGHLAGAADAEALAQKLTMMGGRYAFVVVGPGVQRLYLDPSGCLGAVYEPGARQAASTLFMAIDRPVVPDTSYPYQSIAATGAGGRYAFGLTPDAHVRRLMCNHALDLDTFEPQRHWPHPDMDLTCPMTMDAIEARLETMITRQRQILRGLTGAIQPAMLPISGGDDSRVLLALSDQMLDRYALFFVHRANKISLRDVELARVLAERMDIDLRVFDVVEDDALKRRPRFAARMNVRQKLAMGVLEGGPDEKRREIEVRQALPSGGAVFRGNVTDVSKAVLWRPVGIREFIRTRGAYHDPRLGVRLLMLGIEGADKDPWCLNAYSDWMADLPQNARARTLDFASLEQFRTHGQGAFFYATNRNFYQTPSADRTILQALISMPPHLRDAFFINDMLIERTAPQLAGVPFTRDTANAMRAARGDLQDWLTRGPDRL
ncbi:MAG: hypothetical protein AAGM21_10855 [Pseudomonadota bacterium]